MPNPKRQREILKQNRLLIRQEAVLERDVLELFQSVAGEMSARFAAAAPDAVLALADEARPGLLAILRRRNLQTALIFGERVIAKFTDAYGGDPMKAKNSDVPARFLETKGAWEVFQSTILDWVRSHGLLRSVSIMETFKDAVRGVIEDALEEGASEAEIARAIQEEVGGTISRSNAARVARTEAHTASTTGSDMAARSTGLDSVKEWAAVEDRRTRESHALADGQEVEMDETFTVGRSELAYPGEDGAPAGEVINCRCQCLYHPRIGGVVYR